MIVFNEKKHKVLTIEQALAPAMKITDPQEAQQYLKDYVEYLDKWAKTAPFKEGTTAESVAKANLGYYAGYYDDETRARIEKLFSCTHPVFGSIEKNGVPTSEEAFQTGFQKKTLEELRDEKADQKLH